MPPLMLSVSRLCTEANWAHSWRVWLKLMCTTFPLSPFSRSDTRIQTQQYNGLMCQHHRLHVNDAVSDTQVPAACSSLSARCSSSSITDKADKLCEGIFFSDPLMASFWLQDVADTSSDNHSSTSWSKKLEMKSCVIRTGAMSSLTSRDDARWKWKPVFFIIWRCAAITCLAEAQTFSCAY